MELSLLFGNEALKSTLLGFASKRAFPNAFMISGAEGSGKSTAALLFAMAIACEGDDRPCGKCSACRKISEGISPDVITVGLTKDRKTIGIESVRQIIDSAYILPNDLDVKIYIIKEAEKLTDQAQNALLKIFEEGPSKVYFILLTSAPSRLLPTVRSRAPEIKTEVFADQRLSELLISNVKKAAELNSKDSDAFKRIISAAGGSYGRALSILEGKNKKTPKLIKKAENIVALMAQKDVARLQLALIEESGDRENYSSILSLLMNALRDLVLIKKGGDGDTVFYSDREEAYTLSGNFSINILVRLCSILDELYKDVTLTNINVRTAAVIASGRLADVL